MFKFLSKSKVNYNDAIGQWTIKSPIDGQVVAIEKVGDQIYSKKKYGDGIALIPLMTNNSIVSPVDGEVIEFNHEKKSYKFKLCHDIEVLMSIGLDEELKNTKKDFFGIKIEKGKKIKTEDVIVEINFDLLKKKNIDAIIPIAIIIKDAKKYTVEMIVKNGDRVKKGDDIVYVTQSF